jgi:hypothetical protein
MKTIRRISKTRAFARVRILTAVLLVLAAAALVFLAVSPPASAQPAAPRYALTPKFSPAVAFDISPALRDLRPPALVKRSSKLVDMEIRRERGPELKNRGHSPDGALQTSPRARTPGAAAVAIPSPLQNFEGLSNLDNFNIFGFRVNPPDNMGDVGPNHYVQLINLVLGIFDKTGTKLVGPVDIGALWAGFAVPDCTDASGDPVVLYDQLTDRWILSQFTTSGLDDPDKPFWNCVAISTTGDPTGTYYRYAFETAHFQFFPDYPKYGVWTNSYVITTREFGPTVEYGIGVYGLEKNKMINGQPARSVSFFIDGNDPALLPLVGDGLLPADIDGKQKPMNDAAIPIVGTQDDGAGYGATFDAINIFDLRVHWNAGAAANATLRLAAQLPTAAFDSVFPCGPDSRDCLPQPGITNPAQYLDFLSRERPTWRLAYRNFKGYEALVTNQQVEAAPGVAGVRWYEIRRDGAGNYSLYQQGTYAPGDGVHRWMGSVAQDKMGNIVLGYSVVNGTTVYPGIRYTGRLAGDPLGQMTLGEATVINGTGVQTTTNSRWGDYTSMNVDPTDDCTFWYVNEYYQVSGVPLPLPPPPLPPPGTTAPWQTRIASFKLPGCH